MAKGAATENQLGGLHSLLTKVFQRTLEKYLKELDALESINKDDVEDELVAAALAELGEPNPAMLSAISKFLKDNDIGFDAEEVDELNSTARRLEERRKARQQSGLRLVDVPHVEAG